MLKHLDGHIEFLWTDKDEIVLSFYDNEGDLEYECIIPEKPSYQLYLLLDKYFGNVKKVVKETLKKDE